MHARHALILAAILPLVRRRRLRRRRRDRPGDSPLTVSGAASLQEALTECAPDAKLQFAGSDELAAQIRQGAPVDVLAAANTKIPDELAGEGKLEEPVAFASNQLVLAVPADSDIQGLDDLEGDGVRLVIGAEGVPVGDYTRTVLGNLPPAQGEAILANVRSEEPDVKGVVGKLAQGAADAGFVYATDVAGGGRRPARDRAAGRRSSRSRRMARAWSAPPSTRTTPRRSSTASSTARATTRCSRRASGSRDPRLVRRRDRAGARRRADVPDAADRRAVRRAAAGRAARRAGGGGGARRALALPAHDDRGDGPDRRDRHAGRLLPRHAPPLPRPQRADHADRASAGAPAGGRGHRAARRGRPGGPARRRGRGRGAAAHARHRRRRRGAHVRRRAVPPAPGDRRVRGGRPGAARRQPHARRDAGADVPARRDPRRAARAGRRDARSRWAARSASSARR